MPSSLPSGHLRCFPVQIGSVPGSLSFAMGFDDPRPGDQRHNAVDIWGSVGGLAVFPVAARVVRERKIKGEMQAGLGELSRGRGWYANLLDRAGYVHYFSHLAGKPVISPDFDVCWPAYFAVGRVGGHGLHYQVVGPIATDGRDFTERVIRTSLPSLDPYEELKRIALLFGATVLDDKERTVIIPPLGGS